MNAQRRTPPEQLLDILRPLNPQTLVNPIRQVRIIEQHIPPKGLRPQSGRRANTSQAKDSKRCALKPTDQRSVDIHPGRHIGFALAFLVE